MSIKKMIRNTLILIGLLLVLAIGAAIYGGKVAIDATQNLAQKAMPAAILYQDVALSYERARKYEKEFFVFANNAERRERYLGDWNKGIEGLNKQLSEGAANANKAYTAREARQFAGWKEAVQVYATGFRGLADNVKNGTIPDGITANQENGKNVDSVREFAKEVTTAAGNNVKEANTAANDVVQLLKYAVGGIVVLLILVLLSLIVLGRSIPSKISSAISDYTKWVDSMSKGDLKQEMVSSEFEEFAPLSEGLRRLRNAMSMAMERLRSRS